MEGTTFSGSIRRVKNGRNFCERRRGIGREEVAQEAQEAARGAKEALREEVDAAISSGELRGERGERGEKGDDGHLLALVNDGQTLPGMEIDTGSGHLIYKIT